MHTPTEIIPYANRKIFLDIQIFFFSVRNFFLGKFLLQEINPSAKKKKCVKKTFATISRKHFLGIRICE